MGLRAGPCTIKHKGRVIEETICLGSLQLTEKAEIRPLGDTKCLVRWRSSGAVTLHMLVLHRARVSWKTGTLAVPHGAATLEALAAVTRPKPGGRVRTFDAHDHLPRALIRQSLLTMVFGT